MPFAITILESKYLAQMSISLKKWWMALQVQSKINLKLKHETEIFNTEIVAGFSK